MTTKSFAIIGDLHYETKIDAMIRSGLKQIEKQKPNKMISLGDLGGYSHPGSELSFREARELFDQLPFPTYPIIGNHDLEGREYLTDQANIEAWLKNLRMPSPYYAIEEENDVFVLLSTTAFRENPYCCNEVYVDPIQKQWFEETCQSNPHKNIYVFTHAPILGSGLRALIKPHLYGGNAWVNHSREPFEWIHFVHQYPQIKFWASGHTHLSQNYSDSISHQGNCLFCHTGVIGNCTRDQHHQSRWVTYDQNGLCLYTIDHTLDQVIPIVELDFKTNQTRIRNTPTPPPNAALFASPSPYNEKNALVTATNSFLTLEHQSIIEYDKKSKGIIGVVALELPKDIHLKMNQTTLEVYHEKMMIHSFPQNKRGYYSEMNGYSIEQHALGKIIANHKEG